MAASPTPVARLALTVSYDGSDFAGSQVQPGQRTVQAETERALARLFGADERTVFAGRTDRGVHAAGQVVGSSDRRPDWTTDALRSALNALLPEDVAVQSVARRPNGFHARYDARWREYRYRVWTGERQPLARRQVWHRPGRLDLAAMAEGANRVVGEHDFAALAGGGEGVPWSERRERPRGTFRRIVRCGCVEIEPWWTDRRMSPGRLIEVRVVADGFLPRMVRNLTGVLIEIGRGARPPEWIETLLHSRDRRYGAATAPPHGLTFWRVGYGDDVPTDQDQRPEPLAPWPVVGRAHQD